MDSNKIMICNSENDVVFAVVVGDDNIPKIQVKQGKGKHSYRDIDVDDAIPKIIAAVKKIS